MNVRSGKLDKIIFFKRYPFREGQKIHIEDGPRKGDWQVLATDNKKVTLLCPVSGRQVEWDRFCYYVEEKAATWPAKD